MLSRSQPLMEGANERLKKTLKLVVGFFAGCVATVISLLGDWAWSLPVVLAGAAMACGRTSFWFRPIPDENLTGHRAPNL